MKEKLSTKELAEILDCTPKTLADYKQAGIIKSKLRSYSVGDITSVVKHLRSVAGRRDIGESEKEIKIRREKIRCEREERKNAVEAGKLISKDEEYRRDFQTARTVRDGILNACERVRPQISHEQYIALKTEMTTALMVLAEEGK